MTIHTLRLATEPFEAIKAGQKTIESRLYDAKRQSIQPGDQIIFVNREDPAQSLRVEIIGLHRFRTFHELFEHSDITKFAQPSIEVALQRIHQVYRPQDEAKYTVLGIEFKIIA